MYDADPTVNMWTSAVMWFILPLYTAFTIRTVCAAGNVAQQGRVARTYLVMSLVSIASAYRYVA